MTEMTPEQEAAYALDNKLSRESLSNEAQTEYDRLVQERFLAATHRAAEMPDPSQEAEAGGERKPWRELSKEEKREEAGAAGDEPSGKKGAI